MTAFDSRSGSLLEDLASIDSPRMAEVLDLLGSADALSRFRYEPGHVTGSAFVVHPHDPTVALIHHDKLDLWVQPGGHVEPSDPTVEAAARREIAEEIGTAHVETLGPLDLDIHVFPGHGDQPTHLHFDVRYLYRALSEELVLGEGVREARWVSVDDALRLDDSVARPVRLIAERLGW